MVSTPPRAVNDDTTPDVQDDKDDADQADAPKKPRPMPWLDAPGQSLPERQQGLADIKALLADPSREYGRLPHEVSALMYVFSGRELRRILLGLAKLLEENALPPIRPLHCRQCGIVDVPKLTWQGLGASRRIRATCAVCNSWIKWVSLQHPAHRAAADAAGVAP